jgi:adenine-specific DNA-methyltransferase
MATLHFKGKSAVWNHHLSVPYHTLEKDDKKSLKGENSDENLIIEGDNLLALKSLLPQYQGQVKCIYIDPPYNTGDEGWVYNDNVNSPTIREWMGEVVGPESKDLTRHDKWLCMMTPRLKLLRELLSEDGVIFASIDDNEAHHLRSLMNEVFGADNFVAQFVWRRSGAGGLRGDFVVNNHEYVVAFAKNKEMQPRWYAPYSEASAQSFDAEDENGRYKTQALYLTSLKQTKKQSYFIELPDGTKAKPPEGRGSWRFIESTYKDELANGRIVFKETPRSPLILKDGTPAKYNIYTKQYIEETGTNPPTWISEDYISQTRSSKAMLNKLFGGVAVFDYAKPVELITFLLKMIQADKDAVVLDSFSGSGTTAQVVMDMNAEDDGNRKFILVQLPEEVKKGTDAYKAGYRWMHEITRDRVLKVIEENGYKIGFTYQTLGPSIDAETILSGKLPTYTEFAKYVYYLATGKNHPKEKDIKEKEGFVGKSEHESIYLLYEKDMDKLKKLAITLDWARETNKKDSGKKIVYAPACYLDDELLAEFNIKFVSIPYNLFEHKK